MFIWLLNLNAADICVPVLRSAHPALFCLVVLGFLMISSSQIVYVHAANSQILFWILGVQHWHSITYAQTRISLIDWHWVCPSLSCMLPLCHIFILVSALRWFCVPAHMHVIMVDNAGMLIVDHLSCIFQDLYFACVRRGRLGAHFHLVPM